MAVQHRGSVAAAATASVSSISVTIPAGVVAGDNMLALVTYNPTTASPTTPTGWTLVQAHPLSGSSTMAASFYERTAQAGDGGTTLTFSGLVGQRASVALTCHFSTSGRNIFAFLDETATNTVHANATATSTASGCAVSFSTERSSTPSTSISSVPASFTSRASAFGTGSGACSVGVADNLSTVSSGSTIGGGNWTWGTTNPGELTLTVGLSDASNVAPTGNAGADVTNGQVGVAANFTGSDSDSDGTVASRAWTLTAKPAASSKTSSDITNATSQAMSFTPDVQGLYTFTYIVTDNVGATSTPDTADLYVPGNAVIVRSTTSNPGGWIKTGGGTPAAADITDTNDSTGEDSAAGTTNPSKIRHRLEPLNTPTSFSLVIRALLVSAGTGTMKVRLYEGSTQRKEWLPTSPSTSVADMAALTLTGGEIATVTSWLALDLEFEWGI